MMIAANQIAKKQFRTGPRGNTWPTGAIPGKGGFFVYKVVGMIGSRFV